MVLSQSEAHAKATQETGLCSVTTFKALSNANMKTHLIRETASSSSVNKLNKQDLISRHQSMWNDLALAPDSGIDSIFEEVTSNFAAINPMAQGVVIQAKVNQTEVFQEIFEVLLSSRYVSEDNLTIHKAAVAACGISEPSEIEFLVQMNAEIEKIASLITSLGKFKLEKALAKLTPPVIIASINVAGVAPVTSTPIIAVVPSINSSHVATPAVVNRIVLSTPLNTDVLAPVTETGVVPSIMLSTVVTPVVSPSLPREATTSSPFMIEKDVKDVEIDELQKIIVQMWAEQKSSASKGKAPKNSKSEDVSEVEQLRTEIARMRALMNKQKTHKSKGSKGKASPGVDNDDDDDDDDDEDDEESSISSRGTAISKTVADPKITGYKSYDNNNDADKYADLNTQLVKDGKYIFPKMLKILNFEELAAEALSSGENSGLLSFTIELGVWSSAFRSVPGQAKKIKSLQAKEITGTQASPTPSNRSSFLSNTGINYVPTGYPQTIKECMDWLDHLMTQSCHEDSTLSKDLASEWVRAIIRFKTEITILIKTLLPLAFDSPQPKHLVNRALVCRAFFIFLNRAIINEEPALLHKNLTIEFGRLVDPFTNGTTIDPAVFTAMLQLLGMRCTVSSCGTLGENSLLCYACQVVTPLSIALFPPKTATSTPTTANNPQYKKWAEDRRAAKIEFQASPAGALFRTHKIDARDLHRAFVAAFPLWDTSNAPSTGSGSGSKAAVLGDSSMSPKVCDIGTCHDYVYRNQIKFGLPYDKRSC